MFADIIVQPTSSITAEALIDALEIGPEHLAEAGVCDFHPLMRLLAWKQAQCSELGR